MAIRTLRKPQTRDLLLVGGITGCLIGASMVAMSPGLGSVTSTLSSIIRITRADEAAATSHHDPVARAITLDGACTAGCATALYPGVQSRSWFDEVVTSGRGQPLVSNRDPEPNGSSALSLTSQSFSAREWLFIAGMSIRHLPPAHPAQEHDELA